jgi:hypothetical protein
MQRFAGFMLLAGSVLFFIAIFTPVYLIVFGAIDNPQQKVEYLESHQTGWSVATAMTAAGSLLAVIGLALFTSQVQIQRTHMNIRLASYLAAALAAVGVLFWLIICYYRLILSPQDRILNHPYPNWYFVVYSFLTAIALILIGFVLLQAGFPKWLGWVVLVIGGLELVVYVVLGDLPPAVHYLPFLIMGATLLFTAPPRQLFETQ